MRRILLSSSAFVLAVAVAGCGKKTDRTISSTNTGTTDNASDLVQEAVDSASAGESSTATGFVQDLVGTVSRTCTASGNNAVVTVSGDIGSNQTTISRTNATGTRTITGTMTETRTWSKTGGAIGCATTGGHADLSSDLSGVTLAVSATRERSNVLNMVWTNPRTSATRTINKTTANSVASTRTVTWAGADDTSTVSGHTIRTKTVASSATRTITKDGTTVVWTIKTADASPLTIKVERVTSGGALVSKTISGTLISSNSTEATKTIEKTFTNFLMTHSGDECTPTSGTLSIVFKTDGTQTEKVDCTAGTTGDLTCTNVAGESVLIDSPACDPTDKI